MNERSSATSTTSVPGVSVMQLASVVICTRDRAASLAETLACLSRLDAGGIEFEVVVVDNGSRDDTVARIGDFRDRLRIRSLHEPEPGKSHALNRALAAGGLGDVIAFLDDDMSPHRDWLRGVASYIHMIHPEEGRRMLDQVDALLRQDKTA